MLRTREFAAEKTRGSGDGGVDIVLTDAKGKILCQCKNHAKTIGPATVRELYGAMMHFGISRGLLISSSGYTAGAVEFAKDKDIELWGLDELIEKKA